MLLKGVVMGVEDWRIGSEENWAVGTGMFCCWFVVDAKWWPVMFKVGWVFEMRAIKKRGP
jgi:hypothetical protein